MKSTTIDISRPGFKEHRKMGFKKQRQWQGACKKENLLKKNQSNLCFELDSFS